MAVSYLSHVYESNPYVLPVDLNLLQKVNQYKQTQFYRGAEQIKNEFSYLNNLDIANKAQKDLLQQKVSNLTTQLNSVGAIDYSDQNITNAIEGFGNDIVSNEDIMGGIVSTKNMRAFNDNVAKMASDPKLAKYYNTSNITRITEKQIRPYLEGDLKARYNGPTAPRPYPGNPMEYYMKNMKNLPPNITMQRQADGTTKLFNVETNKYLSPEDISAAFDGLTDANMAAQLADDAWYNFDYKTGGMTKDQAMNLYNDDLLNKKNNYTVSVESIDTQLKTEIDPTKKEQLLAQKDQFNAYLSQLDTEITRGNNTFGKLYDENRDNALYSLYVGRFRNDVIKAAGYDQTKKDYDIYKEDQFQKRIQLEYIRNGLILNSDGTTSAIPGWKTKTKKDANGKVIEPVVTGFGQVGTTTRDATATEAQAVTTDVIKSNIETLRQQNNAISQDFIKDFAIANNWQKDLGFEENINTTGAGEVVTLSSDLLRKISGTDKYLDKSDIKAVLDQGNIAYHKGLVDEYGRDKKTGNPYVYNVNKDGIGISMTFQQMKIMKNLNDAFQAFGEGRLDKLPESFNKGNGMLTKKFTEYARKHNETELAVQAAQSYLNRVIKDKYDGLGLKIEDAQLFDDYTKHPEKYNDFQASGNGLNAPAINSGDLYKQSVKNTSVYKKLESIRKQLYDKGYNTKYLENREKEAYATASKALNYNQYQITDDPKNLPDGILNTIRKRGNPAELTGTLIPNNITIADDGMNYKLEYTYETGKADAKKPAIASIQLSPTEVRSMGLKLPSNPNLETIFRYGAQESPKNFITHPNFPQPIYYKIKKMSGGVYMPYVLYKNQEYPVGLEVEPKLPSDAEDAFRTILLQPFKSYDDLIQQMKDGKVLPADQ